METYFTSISSPIKRAIICTARTHGETSKEYKIGLDDILLASNIFAE